MKPPKMPTGSAYGPPRPTSAPAARFQMPQTMGNTAGLTRPLPAAPMSDTGVHGPKKPRMTSQPKPHKPRYDATPVDSKIGYRGQEKAAYDANASAPMIKPSHKGLLHKDLGVPQGQKIPKAKIESAENSPDPKVRKRAVFAENFGHDAAPVSDKIQTNMREMKAGQLHSGSKQGPLVTNPKQAIAISYSQTRKGKK